MQTARLWHQPSPGKIHALSNALWRPAALPLPRPERDQARVLPPQGLPADRPSYGRLARIFPAGVCCLVAALRYRL